MTEWWLHGCHGDRGGPLLLSSAVSLAQCFILHTWRCHTTAEMFLESNQKTCARGLNICSTGCAKQYVFCTLETSRKQLPQTQLPMDGWEVWKHSDSLQTSVG